MIELLVRHLLVLAVAGLLALILRNRSAALRHALWVVALTACILLPILQRLALTVPAQIPFVTAIEWTASTDSAPQPTTGQMTSVLPPAAAAFDRARLAWGIYIAVALVLILRWFVGLQQAIRHARRGRVVEVVRGVPVAVVDDVGPLAFGWPRGTIIVPHAALARNQMMLRHELAHIQRADFLWQAIGYLVCALWWFSPAAWLAYRALRREAEQACDDLVLAAGTPAADYADGLLKVAIMKSGQNPGSAVAVELIRNSDLGRRIAAVLAPATDRRSVRPLAVAGLVLLLLPLTLFVSRPLASAERDTSAALAGRTIVLDPGHGGRDPGTTIDGLRESDVTLAIALRARALFEQAGATVELTRAGDEFLSLRQRGAHAAGRDLFLSVHVDADGGERAGSQPMRLSVIYLESGDPPPRAGAMLLARELERSVGGAVGTGNVIAKISSAPFVVLKEAGSAAFMVSAGVMGSAEGRARLRDPQVLDALARGLVDGAAAALGSQQR